MSTFIDANVFLYAIGADHPMRAGSRAVLEMLRDGVLVGATNAEVLQELLHVLTRRGRVSEALQLVREVAGAVDVLPVDAALVLDAAALIKARPTSGVRDAIHVASMKRAGISEIVSADRGFDDIDGVRRRAPDTFA